MKALLLAAALALTSIPATAAPVQHTTQTQLAPVTDDEIDTTAGICIGVVTGKVTADEVVKELNLNSDVKKRDFLVHCKLFLRGVEVGGQLATQQQQSPTT